MGTFPLDSDRLLRTADHKVFLVEVFTDATGLNYPEQGRVWCNLREKDQDETAFNLTVCYADWTPRWYERWLDAFAAIPEYREQFRISDGPRWTQHPTIATDLPHVGFVEIDELLAPAIRKLNDIGCRTLYCCQGTESKAGTPLATEDAPCAYIMLDSIGEPFPRELVEAWANAGFYASPYAVHAVAPYGLLGAAAIQFVFSLRDWLTGSLDGSGKRYVLTEMRPPSLPPIPALPQKVAESKQAKALRALIKLGKKARFRDYAALKSGTDKWSKMRLPQLKRVLGDTFAEVANSELDDEHQAKYARWLLRGLPSDMALRKVKTDMEIAANAR